MTAPGWDALCEDIRRAEPGSLLFYELIRLAKDTARHTCVLCGAVTAGDEFALADGAGCRCPDVLACLDRRRAHCEVAWGSAAPFQRCTRENGHHGVHIDADGREFGYVPDLHDLWGES